MPEWQRQLEALLAALDVALEDVTPVVLEAESAPGTQTTAQFGTVSVAGEAVAVNSEPEHLREVWVADEGSADDADEVSAIRSEVEATMRRVVSLVHTGRLSRATRDDILFVLQALTRTPRFTQTKRRLSAQQSALSQDWELTSAAAVLRFCRIVLRLADAMEMGM